MATPSPLATVGDLADWIGEPIVAESADARRAEMALRMASAIVRQESRRTWLDEDGVLIDPLPDAVTMVVLSSAGRGYSNPDNFADESLDDWRGRRPDDMVGFQLTAPERNLLAPFTGSKHRGIGTISTTRGDIGAPDDRSWIVNGPDPANPWDAWSW